MRTFFKSLIVIFAVGILAGSAFGQTGTTTGKGLDGDITTNDAAANSPTPSPTKKKNRRAKGNKNDTSTTNPGATSDSHTNAMPNQNH